MRYPGNINMRETTVAPTAQRGERKRKGEIMIAQIKQNKQTKISRMCNDLQKLCLHVNSIATLKNKGRICAFCGLPNLWEV